MMIKKNRDDTSASTIEDNYNDDEDKKHDYY
jgi:hypothetical protein